MYIAYMKNLLLYTILILAIAACSTEVKGPESAMKKSPIAEFAFDKFEHPQFSKNLKEEGLNIYALYGDIVYRLDQHDSEYGKFDVIQLVENKRFDFYVKLYTGRYKKSFQKWLDRSNEYIYIVRDIFREEGVPEELTYLPFTESGFNPSIMSHAGAMGMWQFMKGTGKIYGLKSNFWVEERRDFEKSTRAAARHLQDLHDRLGDWYLAMAAYNAGLGKVLNAIKRYKTRDFFVMSQRKYRYLKLETKDYVPKFLALRYLARNYQEFGFETPDGNPMLFDRVTLYRQANLYVLASIMETDIETIRELNPELMTPMTPPVKEYSIRIPYGKKAKLEEALEHISDDELSQFKVVHAKRGRSVASYAKKFRMSSRELRNINGLRHNTILRSTYLFIPIKEVFDKELNQAFVKELKRYNPKVHRVRRGDSMYRIARKYGMSLGELMSLNRGVNARRIRPGQTVIISDSYFNKRSRRKVVKRRTYTKQHTGSYVNRRHVVRKGESLWSIAKKYGTTVRSIKSKNGLSRDTITPGTRLTINSYKKSSAKNSKVTKYKVRYGDNLWSIAKKFDTSINSLKKKNNLRGSNIKVGDVLRVR